ncbi:MAG: chemotaxis protein CheX [Oscillospiraceae bacterium]|nr:chemotaxis protein CheX [Oscillospiraceae bacterium]
MTIDLKEELCAVFAGALAEVVSTTTGLALDMVSTMQDDGFGEMVGIMNLNSKNRGLIFISAEEEDVRMLYSCMTGVPVEQVGEDDMSDTLCELVNMTAGSVKLRIKDPDYMFSLSSPFVIRGTDISMVTKKRVPVISRMLRGEKIAVKIKVVYS